MGCGVCCLKCLLILFNVLFGIIGAVLLAAGAFVLASANDTLKPYLDGVLESIPGMPDDFNLQDAQQVPVGGVSLDIAQVLNSVAMCLVVMGAFLLITSIFGAFGACCSSRVMLYIYAAIVILLFVIQLLLVILFFTGALDKTIKGKMKGMIENSYVGIDDYTLPSLAWNVLMAKFACCGVDGIKDFVDVAGPGNQDDVVYATKWNRERQISIGVSTVTVYLQTPFACCKFDGTFPSVTPVDDSCAHLPTSLNSNKDTGCWGPLWSELDPFMTIIQGAVAGILIFQALCAAAAIIIAVQMQKEKGQTV